MCCSYEHAGHEVCGAEPVGTHRHLWQHSSHEAADFVKVSAADTSRGPTQVYEEAVQKFSESAPTLPAVRQSFSRVQASLDLHQLVFHDLALQQHIWRVSVGCKTEVPGYLQHVAVYPPTIYLYSAEQLQLLNSEVHLRPHLSVHLDATGSLCPLQFL